MAVTVQCYNNVHKFLQGVNFSEFGELQEICECLPIQMVLSFVSYGLF